MEYNEEKLLQLHGTAKTKKYGNDLIKKYPEKFDWGSLSCSVLDDEILDLFGDRINWTWYSQIQIPENQLYKYIDKLDMEMVSIFQNLSDQYIINNYDRISIKKLLNNRHFKNREKSKELLTFLKLKGIDINEI